MKLRRLKIAGFRGFNSERTIEFDERLTLLSAPNSYGKTSIAEALEFLLFGETSRVEGARGKEEYQDSYRNRHYAQTHQAVIEAEFLNFDGTSTTLTAEIDAAENVQRRIDGRPVPSWPFAFTLESSARPFVVQHALKWLLLVPPSERFQGFAKLLGLRHVNAIQQVLINLATKPESNLPVEARDILAKATALESRIASVLALAPISRAFRGGLDKLSVVREATRVRIQALVGSPQTHESKLEAARTARAKATASVYEGSVTISNLSAKEKREFEKSETQFDELQAPSFIDRVGQLATQASVARLRQRGILLESGVALLDQQPGECPLCERALPDGLGAHIRSECGEVKQQIAALESSNDPNVLVRNDLVQLRDSLSQHARAVRAHFADLLKAGHDENRKKIETLFGPSNLNAWQTVESAIEDVWLTTIRTAGW